MTTIKVWNSKTKKTEVREQTPEEIAQEKERKILGDRAIQAREKALSRGANKEQANQAAITASTLPEGTTATPKTIAEVQANANAEQTAQQEYLNKNPTEIARDIPINEINNPLPVNKILPPGVSNIAEPFIKSGEQIGQTILTSMDLNKIQNGEATPDEIRSISQRFNLNDLDIEVIKSGEAHVSTLNQIVEGIPAIGPITRYVNMFSQPSKKVCRPQRRQP